MRRQLLYLLLVALCFYVSISTPRSSYAQNQELDLRLSAQNTSYESGLVSLEGNVEIAVGDQIFKADRATVDRNAGTIKAEGNVVLVSADTVIEGDSMDFNYRTKLGKIENGFVQNGSVVFEGRSVEKTGENTYVANQARFTSCINCAPTWSFSGSQIDAEMGGYAYIKYPVLRILDFPVFILPRILVPLKSDRQSGLLVPSIDLSERGGFAISQSYFWAISRSEDMTFTLKKWQKRGIKGLVEHREVIDENSQSYFQGGYMKDEAYTVDGDANSETYELERGFFVYKRYHKLPEGYVHRVNLNYLSDLRYIRDFSDELTGHGDPALLNSTSITQNTDNSHRSAEVSFYLNLLQNENSAIDQGDAFSRNDNAVHKWPELRYSVVDTEIANSNLFYKFDINYTHFARRDQSFDNNPNGTDDDFDPEEDFIRTGHRLILTPEISYPVQIANFFTITPRIKYSESQYRFTPTPGTADPEYEKNASRRYLQTDLEMGTVFTRIYETSESTRLKHEVLPEVIYSEIPWVERPDHPFFGNYEEIAYSRSNESLSQEDLDFDTDNGRKPGLQFDYRDRLFDKKLVTFQFTNNFVKKTLVGGNSTYKKIATHRIRQSYDINESKRENPHPWGAVYSLLDLRFDHFETHTTTEYYPYANVTNWNSRIRVMSDYGNYAEVSYTYKRYIDENNESTDTRNENMGLGLGFRSTYMDLFGKTTFSLITNQLESWEYIAAIKVPGECFSLRVGHREIVGSDTQIKFDMNFEFGGT